MTDELYRRHRRTDLRCGSLRFHTESRVTASRPPRRQGSLVKALVILLTIGLCPADDLRRIVLLDWVIPEPGVDSGATSPSRGH